MQPLRGRRRGSSFPVLPQIALSLAARVFPEYPHTVSLCDSSGEDPPLPGSRGGGGQPPNHAGWLRDWLRDQHLKQADRGESALRLLLGLVKTTFIFLLKELSWQDVSLALLAAT